MGFNSSGTRRRRRRIAGLVTLGTIAMSLAACGDGGSDDAAGGKVTITFMNDQVVAGMPLEQAIHKFEQENPDIKVDVLPVPSESDYEAKMRTSLASSKPPDVFRINDDYVQLFTQNGTLFDLAPYVKSAGLKDSDYAAQVFNFGKQSDGRMTSWQLGYQSTIVFYNVNAFKKAGLPLPPGTWSGKGWTTANFLADAQKMTDGTKMYGATVSAATNYEQTFTHNNGSQDGVYSADGKKFTLADPIGVQTVQWVADLTCKYHVQPAWADLLQDNADIQLFAQGKTAMLFEQSGSVPYLRQTIKSFDWDIAPPPAGTADQANEASVVSYAVPAKAKHHDAAFKLLNYLAGPEAGQILGKGGAFTPVNNQAAEAISKASSGAPKHADLLAEAAHHLTAGNKTNNTLGARAIYRPALDQVYNCKSSAQDVLSRARPQVEQALGQG
ncbi:ABC transporter substrate-binding protein [Kribbella pratensis]|uniref:Carbohydrate ABC transporter substrate-binding protein (CUT1 family) n=1 Tax=Kribbella pratensis TaxID=2512112 RepID=A0A4R8CP21_9ACTN|nr:sugar ABC transporter substrate-binding protein [Kribbella pratensis]TDW77896.1 carbohydrate ABC transporter substrate-binding protein (CUT1 family) [Kribbella pratensis]